MSVVGFDFGNNACKIAIARKGAIDVIMNDCSNRNTPSVVGYTDANRQIGEAGLAQHVTNYKNTVTEVKRLLGRSWADEEFKADVAQLPFKVVADGEKVVVDVAYNNDRVQLSPEQITAALLTHLKSLAENALEIRVSDCVVSVPSFWTDKMRRALLDAAAIAGLNVLRLMNENSAIALQYGLLRQLPEKQPMKTLFFDMGHSQTTVTLVSFVQGSLTMLGSASHRSLGGRDFDRAIANHMMAFAKDKYKLDLASNVKAVLRVLKQCERTKKMLTANIESPFNLECIMNDVDVKGTLTREQFETLSAPLLEQVLIPVRECLALTGVDPKEVDSIELVGGGSRIIAVRRALKEFFGRDLSTTCNADESVARGCALQCAMLSPSVRVREFAVNDVTPLSVTVGWRDLGAAADEESVVLFSKFNAIPSVKQIAFNKAGPFSVTARYTHASDLPVGHDTFIARFDINSLPANCTREKLKVKMDLHGLISVVGAQAMEETKDDEAQSAAEAAAADAMEVEQVSVNAAQEAAQAAADEKKKRKYKKHEIGFGAQFAGGLSADAVRAATEVEGAQSLQDRVIAETAEKRNELESFIYETRSALDAELQPFLKADAIAAFQKQLDAAESWLDEVRDQDTPVQKSDYVRKLAELKAVTDPAERRRGEQKNRAEAISALKSAATKYRLQAVSPDAKFAHIEAGEKAKIVAAVDELESWLQGAVQKQDALNGTDEPVFTCADLNNKRAALSKLADPIMSKPVPAAPKPEAAPQPAPQAAPAADAAAAAPAPETGMDLD